MLALATSIYKGSLTDEGEMLRRCCDLAQVFNSATHIKERGGYQRQVNGNQGMRIGRTNGIMAIEPSNWLNEFLSWEDRIHSIWK